MHNADSIRSMLAKNAELSAKAGAHGDRIREAAAEELEKVEGRLKSLTPASVVTNEVTAAEYRRLIEDRARLTKLIGRGTRS